VDNNTEKINIIKNALKNISWGQRIFYFVGFHDNDITGSKPKINNKNFNKLKNVLKNIF